FNLVSEFLGAADAAEEVDSHGGSAVGKFFRDGAPNAARRACHEGDSAFQWPAERDVDLFQYFGCHKRAPLRKIQFVMASKMAAIPCPPPMHMVTSAYFPPILRSSCKALTVTMAPVAPRGCPREIPLPFGFVFSGGNSSSRRTASSCAANASFNSITSI